MTNFLLGDIKFITATIICFSPKFLDFQFQVLAASSVISGLHKRDLQQDIRKNNFFDTNETCSLSQAIVISCTNFLFIFNWHSLQTRLNSHYEQWSHKRADKKKPKDKGTDQNLKSAGKEFQRLAVPIKKLLTLENTKILQKNKGLEPIRPVQMNINQNNVYRKQTGYICTLEYKSSREVTSARLTFTNASFYSLSAISK